MGCLAVHFIGHTIQKIALQTSSPIQQRRNEALGHGQREKKTNLIFAEKKYKQAAPAMLRPNTQKGSETKKKWSKKETHLLQQKKEEDYF